jgi:phosphoglycerol transferase MdoB-like AlkP superfamily enzyme
LNPINRLHDYSITRFTIAAVLAAATLSAAGCTSIPPPPYQLAFTLSGQAPRVLRAQQEITVPLNITNSGLRGWDPAGVRLSYHWLWIVPPELARRSRTVPYHDGIRTELPEPVAPAGRMAVQGRLLAPSWPGLYWLQWDMVAEGVTWFAQVSPRQPRQLVVVVPTLNALATPLPLMTALVGIWAVGVARRGKARLTSRPQGVRVRSLLAVAASADAVWCAATLFAKPLMLVREALLEPTSAAYGLIMFTALVPVLLCLALPTRRVRAGALLLCGVLGTFVILGDALYYWFFGDVLSASAVFAARQTGQVWSSIHSLFTPRMIWLLLDVPFAVWLTISAMRFGAVRLTPDATDGPDAPGRSWRLTVAAALAVTVVAAAVPTAAVLRRGELEQMFRNRAMMEQLGPFGYHAYDAWTYMHRTLFRPAATPAQVADARAWFAARAPMRAGTGPYFGAARGRNLIVVQVESMQDFVVDCRVNGQDVMPHLRRWTNDGVRFTNVTDQTNEGRTSDAEFAALVSLLPLDHGAVAFRFPGHHYVGLPSVLTEHGYATLSAVPFESGFWNRRVMHATYGFQRSLFEPEFELTEQIGWGLNDRDFLQQMVPRLTRLSRPFAAWLITLSLHHPFDDFPERHKTLKLGALERTSFGNYLHTMHFFDQAFDDFQRALARAGLLDDTLLVVFGDHDAGFPRNAALASTIGIGTDATAWELNDRVPLLMKVPGQGRARPTGDVPLAAGQTDFAPTLLALLGIDPADLPYAGRNLLGTPGDFPLPRPYGDWLDRRHLFVSGSRSDRGGACFALSSGALVSDSACRATNDIARRSREISQLVVVDGLQQRLRDSLQ